MINVFFLEDYNDYKKGDQAFIERKKAADLIRDNIVEVNTAHTERTINNTRGNKNVESGETGGQAINPGDDSEGNEEPESGDRSDPKGDKERFQVPKRSRGRPKRQRKTQEREGHNIRI